MTAVQDLSNMRFGKLIVQYRVESPDNWTRWLCFCECGNTTIVRAGNLKSGAVLSCGCAVHEGRNARHGHSRGGKPTSEYTIWQSMIKRCHNTNFKHFKNYGGRGIIVCDRWRFGENGKSGFQCFIEDMGLKPTPKHTIDRYPDNDGGYEPANCRWATRTEQMWNQRVYLEYKGELKSIQEWAIKSSIAESTIRSRLYRKKPIDAIFYDAIWRD